MGKSEYADSLYGKARNWVPFFDAAAQGLDTYILPSAQSALILVDKYADPVAKKIPLVGTSYQHVRTVVQNIAPKSSESEDLTQGTTAVVNQSDSDESAGDKLENSADGTRSLPRVPSIPGLLRMPKQLYFVAANVVLNTPRMITSPRIVKTDTRLCLANFTKLVPGYHVLMTMQQTLFGKLRMRQYRGILPWYLNGQISKLEEENKALKEQNEALKKEAEEKAYGESPYGDYFCEFNSASMDQYTSWNINEMHGELMHRVNVTQHASMNNMCKELLLADKDGSVAAQLKDWPSDDVSSVAASAKWNMLMGVKKLLQKKEACMKLEAMDETQLVGA